jgi:hypothetical protein
MKARTLGVTAGVFAVLVVAMLGFSVLATSSSAGAMPATAPTSGASATSTPTISATTAAAPAATPAAAEGPHPGTLESYLLAPGGTTSLDPSVAYYTVPYEPILNVYQTLITFNGTDTGPSPSDWTPEIAACTPGSAQCTAAFGNTLVSNNQYYTFVIDANAHFYDPNTSASWGVYPSDVMFSLARTMGFGNLPYEEFSNGWIQEQWALPAGNTSWDNGIHGLFNNTPQWILSSMLVNDSAYCPTLAMSSALYHGCITFNVGASGTTWPYFLELIGDGLGASVEPCGWFTYIGAGLPGFDGTSAARGDGPCLLPGNATSTSATGFQNFLSTFPATGWDAVQELNAPAPESPQRPVQYNMVGSGPYYLVPDSANPAGGAGGQGGYTLGANPAYIQPAACTGVTGGRNGCEPPAGSYIANVIQTYENSDTVGVQALIAGTADTASWDPSHTPTIQQLVSEGKYDLYTNISGGTANWFMPFEENISLANERAIDPTTQFNVPTDFLADNGLRNFLSTVYPYSTIQNTVWTVDGLQTTIEYGGAIPPGQSSYYPANVSWPYLQGNPNTDPSVVDGAAWWWAQITNPSNPLYDPELAACSSSSPCMFPIIGWVGNPSLDNAISDWITEIKTFTGGAISPYSFDLTATGTGFYGQIAYGQGNGSMPVYNWGWVADYNDPTDFFLPMWQPNGTYTFAMGTWPVMYSAATTSAACGHATVNWTNLVYWANYPDSAIPTACEGTAYQEMNGWINNASHESDLAFRTLVFNEVEHIGNELALMVYVYCNLANYAYGPWLSPTGININPAVGAAAVQTWYTWAYASTVSDVTFTQSGLTAGTSWSVTVSGTTLTSTGGSIVFAGLTNGSYPYTVTFVNGYTASPASGTVTVAGSAQSIPITYAAITPPTYPLSFTESGLIVGTSWGVTVTDVGSLTSTGTTITFDLAAATYDYVAAPVIGYDAPAAGNATLASPGTSVALAYTPVSTQTYNVNFMETGLPVNMTTGNNAPWGVTLGGATYDSITPWNNFTVLNGTYAFSLVLPTGFSPPSSAGSVFVNGQDLNVLVPLSTAGTSQTVTFNETGLPSGASWTPAVFGFGIPGTGTSISFSLPNGVYNWSVTTIAGYATQTWSGSFTVSGAAVSVSIAFAQFTYPVTFFENGLPTGASWSVTAGGNTVTTTSYFLTAYLPNGTNAFTVTAPSGFVAQPASGGVLVSGAPATTVILFATEYTVTFTETGLPSGASWSVYFGTQTLTSTSSTITASSPNGTFGYGVAGPSGYFAPSGGGSVKVSGAAASVTVAFSPTSSSSGISSSTGLSTLAYGLIGLFVVLTVIFLAVALMARGKKPPASPQTWTSGQESSGEGSNQTPPPTS